MGTMGESMDKKYTNKTESLHNKEEYHLFDEKN